MPTDSTSHLPADAGSAPGGCLVLVPGGESSPVQLLSALTSRALSAHVVHDEPGVMAGLAKLGGGRRVLVIVEPERWSRLGELVCAVQAYHRDVLCWQFVEHNGSGPRLAMLDQSVPGPGGAWADQAGAGGSEPPAGGGGQPGAGVIGMADRRRRAIDDLVVKVPGRTLSTREVVTQQELTMLLGPAPGEAG